MREIWLHTNRRAIALAMVLPGLAVLLGGTLLFWPIAAAPWLRWVGAALAGIALIVLLALAAQWRQPRIARRGNELLFHLRSGTPFHVPLEFVEGFLLGQGASYLRAEAQRESQVSTVVIRLADRATDYAQRDVKPALGAWCNHYVTIRGTWCEPISLALVTRLNTRLAEVQAEARKAQAAR